MSNLDSRFEFLAMGSLIAGVVLAFVYASWLIVGGFGTIGGGGSQAARPQQDSVLLAQNTHAAGPTTSVTPDTPEEQAATATDSAKGETATETGPSETGQAEPTPASEPLFIAGTTPWERPPAAPFFVPEPKDSSWYAKALTGITPPYPASLRFLEDQGAWYTPFNHPGMTAPYDIRDWHGQTVE